MDIIKIIGVGLIAVMMIVILKQYKPEFALYVSLIAGVLILAMALSKITGIITLLREMSSKASINSQFLGILLKMTGIAFLTEFAVSLSNDCGESAIAHKIDLGGKATMITLSLPIISALLGTLLRVIS